MMNWAYIAGFFDGEGCLHMVSMSNRRLFQGFNIHIVQAGKRGKRALQQMQEFLHDEGVTSGIYYHKPYKERKVYSKQEIWELAFGSRDSIVRFLERILPYLTVKKSEAQDALRMFQLYPKVSKEMLSVQIKEARQRRNNSTRQR